MAGAGDNNFFITDIGGAPASRRGHLPIFLNSGLDTTDSDLFKVVYGNKYIYHGSPCRVTALYTSQGVPDTGGAQPSINLKKNGSTNINNAAMTPSSSADTEVSHPVNTTLANTQLVDGDYVEIDYTKGTNGDNEELFVKLVIEAEQ